MSRDMLPENPRLHELLAERALGGLSDVEAHELGAMMSAAGMEDDRTYEMAAAMASVAMVRSEGVSAMPEGLRRKLEARAEAMHATAEVVAKVDFRSSAGSASAGVGRGTRWFPWLVAAASLALAVAAWKPWAGGTGTYNPAQERARFLAMKGSVTASWSDFAFESKAPEITGVQGDVVWNEGAQNGYMRFVGLPANDPSKEQYQLWIVDKRGFSQRVSGGVFDACRGQKECIVKIDPSLPIQGAAAFAVTIEPPGGNAVSDVSRRVCIAAIK
jgi:hypothetical protein